MRQEVYDYVIVLKTFLGTLCSNAQGFLIEKYAKISNMISFILKVALLALVVIQGGGIHPGDPEKVKNSPRANRLTFDAQQHYQNREYPEALAKLDQALQESPLNESTRSFIYGFRGELKMMTRDLVGAQTDLEQAVAIHPDDNKPALLDLGTIYEGRSELEKALELYEQAIALDVNNQLPPTNQLLLWNKARIYQTQWDYKNLEETYARIIAYDPKDAQAYAARAFVVYGNQREDQKALVDYRKAVEINPKDHFSRLNIALTEHALGMKHEACRDLLLVDITQAKGFQPTYDSLKKSCAK